MNTRLQDLLVAIDARLRAFTDREVHYYTRTFGATIEVDTVMLIPKLEKIARLRLSVSLLTLEDKHWDHERLARTYVQYWIEKIKLERPYAELSVFTNQY